MTRPVLAIAVFAFSLSTVATAQTALELRPATPAPDVRPCVNIQGSPESCSKFVGCLGDKGEHFQGTARGWNYGTLQAQTSEGAKCSGTWRYTNVFGIAISDIFCDNGEGGRLYFFAQDSLTGTGIGRGHSNKGRSVKMWSGNNLKQFFRNRNPQAEFPTLHCGPATVPIS